MNLEINDALDQFRRWRNLESRLLFIRVKDGEPPVSWLCRIAGVGKNSLLLGQVGEAHAFTVDRLEEADFEYADTREAAAPGKAASFFVCSMEVTWPTGRSCRFLEVVEDFDPALIDISAPDSKP